LLRDSFPLTEEQEATLVMNHIFLLLVHELTAFSTPAFSSSEHAELQVNFEDMTLFIASFPSIVAQEFTFLIKQGEDDFVSYSTPPAVRLEMKGDLQSTIDDFLETSIVEQMPSTVTLILDWPEDPEPGFRLPETVSLQLDVYDSEHDEDTHELFAIISVEGVEGDQAGYVTMVKKGGVWYEFTTHGHRQVSAKEAVSRGRQELVFYRKME